MKKVLVAGAGSAGTMVVRELQRNPQLRHAPGRIPRRRGDEARQARPRTSRAGTDTRRRGLSPAGTASTKSSSRCRRRAGRSSASIVEGCRAAGVPSRTIPGVYELLGGTVTVSRIRDIEITDLLRRAPHAESPGSVAVPHGRDRARHRRRRIDRLRAVHARSRARGPVDARAARPRREQHLRGARRARARISAGARLPRSSPTSATARRIERVFDAVAPERRLHAAAHKHVPLMEENPEEAHLEQRPRHAQRRRSGACGAPSSGSC